MTAPTKIKSLMEMVDERPNVDNSVAFDELWGIFGALRQRVDERFELQMDDSTRDLQPYRGVEGSGAEGRLAAYSGDEMDWLVHSWIGNPKYSFVNMHLTCWLPATTKVPHLAYALATTPDIFFYMDYVPRVDLMVDTDSLDRYYAPVNARSIELKENPNMNYFTSRSLYVRQALSETALCYTCKYTPENMAVIKEVAHEMMTRWFGWLDAGHPVPQDEQPTLAERDLHIRKTIAERDPANEMGVRLFGQDLTERLVRALWGGDRVLPRVVGN
jgi:hypothetical protein